MTAAVDVVDATGLVADDGAVKRLVDAVLAAEELGGEIAVAFVDEAAIADLNRRYRDAEGPTDVLSFAYADEAARGAVSGEIAICPQVVVRYAAEESRDPVLQLGWTLIHGVLHLAGYDHETDLGEMRARERELLAELTAQVAVLSLVRGGE